MLRLSEHQDPADLVARLRDANAVTADIMSDVISQACRRFPSLGQSKNRFASNGCSNRGLDHAALARIDMELPQWQLRRIAYDEGEWPARCHASAKFPNGSISAPSPPRRSRSGDAERVLKASRIAAPTIQNTSQPCRGTPIRCTSRCSATTSVERDLAAAQNDRWYPMTTNVKSVQVAVRFGFEY